MASIELYDPNARLMLSSDFPTYAFTGSKTSQALHTASDTVVNLFNNSKLTAGVIKQDGTVKEYEFTDVTKLTPTSNPGLILYRESDGKPFFMIDRRPLIIVDIARVSQSDYMNYSISVPSGREYGVILLSDIVDMTASNQWMQPSPPSWEEYYVVTEIHEVLFPKFNSQSITVQIKSSSIKYESDYPVQDARATKYLDFLVVDTTDLS